MANLKVKDYEIIKSSFNDDKSDVSIKVRFTFEDVTGKDWKVCRIYNFDDMFSYYDRTLCGSEDNIDEWFCDCYCEENDVDSDDIDNVHEWLKENDPDSLLQYYEGEVDTNLNYYVYEDEKYDVSESDPVGIEEMIEYLNDENYIPYSEDDEDCEDVENVIETIEDLCEDKDDEDSFQHIHITDEGNNLFHIKTSNFFGLIDNDILLKVEDEDRMNDIKHIIAHQTDILVCVKEDGDQTPYNEDDDIECVEDVIETICAECFNYQDGDTFTEINIKDKGNNVFRISWYDEDGSVRRINLKATSPALLDSISKIMKYQVEL